MNLNNYYNNKKYAKINRFRREAILNFISKKKAVILDVGCSNGIMGEIVKKEREATVFGVDISSEAVQEAKKKIDEAYVLDFAEKDLELPKEMVNKKFDYIVISEVLEHFLQPEILFDNLKKIIKKDTEIIITVPNILFWKNRLKISKGDFNYTDEGLMDKGHIHFFSWDSLKKMIWQTGYEIIGINHHIPTRGTKRIGKLFPGLFAFQFIIKIKKKRSVIYTAIFGGKDNLVEPKYIPDNFDFVCFTDSDFKSDVWQIKKVKPELSDPVRCARKYKILPHRYLPEYDVSFWVDGNMRVSGNVNDLVEKYLKNRDIAVYDHAKHVDDARDCVYEEADTLIKMAEQGGKKYKDDPEIIKKQIEKYKKENYPKHNGLISSMVMLRRHNSQKVIEAMEYWWNELRHNSRRDQLSFNYSVWKNKLEYNYIAGDSRKNKYFLRLLHKRKINYKK